jgi:alpha/beta superfamily hydrolase
MTDHPVLIATRAGVVGGVVTDSDSAPCAAAVIFHGAASTRAGTNQVWAGVARELADLGVVTFRIDYPGHGESHEADRARQLTAVGDAAAWFRARTSDLGLLVVGVCAGVVPGAELALDDGNVRAFAAMTPPVFPAHDAIPPPRAPMMARLAYRARRLPKRLFLRVRYGTPPNRRVLGEWALQQAPDVLVDLTQRFPVWVLTGELDTMTPPIQELAPELLASGNCRIDVVDGLALYSYPSPFSQDVQRERTLAWARETLASELSM